MEERLDEDLEGQLPPSDEDNEKLDDGVEEEEGEVSRAEDRPSQD